MRAESRNTSLTVGCLGASGTSGIGRKGKRTGEMHNQYLAFIQMEQIFLKKHILLKISLALVSADSSGWLIPYMF